MRKSVASLRILNSLPLTWINRLQFGGRLPARVAGAASHQRVHTAHGHGGKQNPRLVRHLAATLRTEACGVRAIGDRGKRLFENASSTETIITRDVASQNKRGLNR